MPKNDGEYEIKVEVTYTCRGSIEDAGQAINDCFTWKPQGSGVSIKNGAYAWQYKSHEMKGPFYKRKTSKEPHNAPTP